MSSVRVTQPLYRVAVEYTDEGNYRTYEYSYYSDYDKASKVVEHIKQYRYIRMQYGATKITLPHPITRVIFEEVGVFDRPFAYGRFAEEW